MRKPCVFILTILTVWFVCGAKVIPLPDINKPNTISVNSEFLAITDGTTFYIYSLKDFSLIKKYGRSGEGPGEFIIYPNLPLRVKFLPDKFFVTSLGKISYFNLKGEYLDERKNTIAFGASEVFPIGEGFAAISFASEEKKTFLTANIYDSQLKPVKEIGRGELPIQGQKFRVLKKSFLMATAKNRIITSLSEDFIIDLFDYAGNKIYTIKPEYEKLKFTGRHKEIVLNYFKTDLNTKPYFDMIQANVLWPDNFPAVRYLITADKELYVHTFLEKDDKTEFYIFDHNGKFLSKKWFPLTATNPVSTTFLYTIHDHTLYRLIEDDEREEWDLHITGIK